MEGEVGRLPDEGRLIKIQIAKNSFLEQNSLIWACEIRFEPIRC